MVKQDPQKRCLTLLGLHDAPSTEVCLGLLEGLLKNPAELVQRRTEACAILEAWQSGATDANTSRRAHGLYRQHCAPPDLSALTNPFLHLVDPLDPEWLEHIPQLKQAADRDGIAAYSRHLVQMIHHRLDASKTDKDPYLLQLKTPIRAVLDELEPQLVPTIRVQLKGWADEIDALDQNERATQMAEDLVVVVQNQAWDAVEELSQNLQENAVTSQQYELANQSMMAFRKYHRWQAHFADMLTALQSDRPGEHLAWPWTGDSSSAAPVVDKVALRNRG